MMPCHSACSCFLSVSIQSLPVCPSVWHAAALMIFLKQTWSVRFPCSAHFCLQGEVQGSGPYFGKSALTGWLFVIIAPEYFTGCEVHKPDCRILWESAVILPVFLPILSECKCGIAILLQEKCSWSESTLLACSDALSGFGNKSLVRYQLPSLCVGKKMATHSSILAWRISRTEKPGRLGVTKSRTWLSNWARVPI